MRSGRFRLVGDAYRVNLDRKDFHTVRIQMPYATEGEGARGP